MVSDDSESAPEGADVTTGLYASTCGWIEQRVGLASPHVWTTALPAVVALSCLALLLWRRLRRTPPAGGLDAKVVAARSALEGITERERQRREQLEAEVQHIRGAI